jgi:hypothetical protein
MLSEAQVVSSGQAAIARCEEQLRWLKEYLAWLHDLEKQGVGIVVCQHCGDPIVWERVCLPSQVCSWCAKNEETRLLRRRLVPALA